MEKEARSGSMSRSARALPRSGSSTSLIRRRSISPFPRSSGTASIEADLQDKSNLHTVAEDESAVADVETNHLLGNGTLISLQQELGQISQSQKSYQDDKPVSWRSLPKKGQLAILVLSRLAEPLAQTSIQAYVYFMLKTFNPELSAAKISSQAGILQASFTATQCVTAFLWGRTADKPWMGRKRVLIVGLFGTCISVAGFGFSKSFYWAVFFRSLGGALNGNISVMRTMISEIVKEKKYQPKAFLVMPVTFNVGSLVGPIMGGLLQDPINSYPSLFGSGSVFGGKDGVAWMKTYPYALPNLVNAVFLFFSALVVILGLEETHIDRQDRSDIGLQIGRWLLKCVSRLFNTNQAKQEYSQVSLNDTAEPLAVELQQLSMADSSKRRTKARPKLPFARIFTKNVIFTLLSHGMMALHVATFQNLWFLFLSTPRADPADTATHPLHLPAFFTFTGGLGLTPSTIGVAIGILGAMGLALQFGLYSRVTHRLGILRAFRLSLALFPFTYLFAPFLAALPTTSAPPHQADGPVVWAAIASLLFVQTLGRTFALPIAQILVNNCTPHPSVLGAVHGIAQSVSSGMRTVGPVTWSVLYGVGLEQGFVGLAWWALSLWAVGGLLVSLALREGSGHEIMLEGDE